MTQPLILDGGPVTIEDVESVAVGHRPVVARADLADRMEPAREFVERAVGEGRVVYGVTTGFGALSSTRIGPDDAARLQISLVRSHAAGVGSPLDRPLVRAMLLLRARTLAQGYSGIRSVFVERYLDFLRLDILPVVPSQGSVGASGDLAPFAHLALAVIGEGLLDEGRGPEPARDVLGRHGLEPLELRPKEGLSLLNGTEGMAAFAALGVQRARRLAVAADAACALSVEALVGSSRPFRAEVHALRPHPGQIESAARIAAALDRSEIGDSHADDFVHAVQDAYSLRCAPQVHGASLDTIDHAAAVVGRELGSVVDNPIVFADRDEVVSAGNFHGQPLAFALDFLTIAVTELSSISERRIDRLLDPQRSGGLPAFLSPDPGVESGLMLAQYTAAALVAENRVLSHPASVESIPTSGSQEDHVSMGWGAGRKLWDVLPNVAHVIAAELLCAAEGVEHRAPLRPSPTTTALIDLIRTRVPKLTADRPIGADITAIADLIESGEIGEVMGADAVRD